MMKQFLSFILVLCITTVLVSISVTANSGSEKIVSRKVVDPDGNVYITYMDEMPEMSKDSIKETILSSSPIQDNLLSRIMETLNRSAPNYTSALSGAWNQYTLAWAKTESDVGIDRMYTYLLPYYAQGTSAGATYGWSPLGWTVYSWDEQRDAVQYEWGSAISKHTYVASGYNEVKHNLLWQR